MVLIGSYKGMLLEEGIDLSGSPPLIILIFFEDEDVVPNSFNDHFRVMNQAIEQFIFDFTIELIFKHFDKVDDHLYQLDKFFVLEYFLFVL